MKKFRFVLLLALFSTAGELWAQLVLNPNPSRVVGHPQLALKTTQPNLVEGRELNNPQSVAVDTSASPPILYVADTGNNRVLAWRDARNFENGAWADLVIGQRDKFSTFQFGPGTTLTSGFSAPTGVAVDDQGRLYVADAGNNRILRFKRPDFSQPDDVEPVDLVIGQAGLNSRVANLGGISAKTLSLMAGNAPYRTGFAFDAQGNMYFTDAGNHRVLRYSKDSLADGAPNQPAADLVLGQSDFISGAPPPSSALLRLDKTRLNGPSGLAFDRAGRLFVTDSLSRVLVYAPPLTSGAMAVRLMGLVVDAQGRPAATGAGDTNTVSPQSVLVINNNPLVIDSGNHRLLRYDPYDLWLAETAAAPAPAAKAVIGQDDFLASKENRGRPEPNATTLSAPVHAAFAAGEVFVVDSGNHRVLAFPDLSSGPPSSSSSPYEARRVLGQLAFDYRARNLIEGREFSFPQGLVVDSTSSPPRLYVADTGNNRVLGFADVRKVRPGDTADLVIGQPDFYRSVPNYPTNQALQPSQSSLFQPAGLAVDREGNLWVADSQNGRVLRFPKPSFSPAERLPKADLVLGQVNFAQRSTDATRSTMGVPVGLAFTPDGLLAVSDGAHNRVLVFQPPFTNGMAATKVFGQADFNSSAAGTDPNRYRAPTHVATDSDGHLYVVDSGNNRLHLYTNVTTAGLDPSPVVTVSNLGGPQGVYVSGATGEIWIAETRSNRVSRYPRFDKILISGATVETTISEVAPQAVTLDGFGNLLVADGASRVAIHFPGLLATNAASGLQRVSPGMYVTLRPQTNASFGDFEAQAFDGVPPMKRQLADTQVLVDDQPVPLHYVGPSQINALIPMSAPTSGTIEIQVVRQSTGQVIASYPVRMDVASPGLFTTSGTGTGQVAALNQDGTLNGPGNAIARGQYISLYGTGQGMVSGAPPDGEPAGGAISTDATPRVIVGTAFVPPDYVQYSGLAPGIVGLWQINVKVPETVAPSNIVTVVVVQNDIPSNNPQNPNQIRTTIAVKQ